MMVLTAVGDYVYLRKDGMAVVPIGSLKDLVHQFFLENTFLTHY